MAPPTTDQDFRVRLKRLVTILEGVHPKQFNMGVWEGGSTEDCGTVCCALGWAMNDPWMQNQGFQRRVTTSNAGHPGYGHSTNYSAAARFFGIAYEDARSLFDPCSYSEEEYTSIALSVIDRINAVLDSPDLKYLPRPV